MSRIEIALLGRYEDAGLQRPQLGVRAFARIAAKATRGGGGARFPNPWTLALRLELDVHEDERCPFDVAADDAGVVMRRLADEGERGLLLFRGLATVLLRREYGTFLPSDALALAAEIALPLRELRADARAGVATVQPWVPGWLLSGRRAAIFSQINIGG